jgi:hypothetical protein
LVLWVLCQATINIAYSSIAASVVDQVPSTSWGAVWGLVGIAQAIGLITGFGLVNLVVPGVSQGLLGLSVFYGACLAPLIVVLRFSPPGVEPTGSGRRPVMQLARNGALGRVWAGRFLVTLANGIAVTYLYYYLQDVIHYPKPGYGQLILVLISTVALMLTAGTSGRMADKSGAHYRYAVIGTALMALVVFEFSIVGTWPLAIAGAFLLGGGYGMFVSMSQALSTLVLPDPGSTARDLGIINIASALPQVIGPPLAAFIIYVGAGYRGIYALAGILLMVAAWVFFGVRPGRKAPRPAPSGDTGARNPLR